MEQAMEKSSCALKAWVPDDQDVEDEERVVLSRWVIFFLYDLDNVPDNLYDIDNIPDFILNLLILF